MRALILAAGRGRRLGLDRPKCLLELGGRTLIERTLDALGPVPATVVVGFRQELLRQTLDGRVTYAVNRRFAEGSLVSLRAGLDAVEDDLLVMDADVIWHPEIVRRLLASAASLAFAVDPSSASGGEEMMVTVAGGRVREVSRRPAQPFDWMGETVGFTKIAARHLPLLRSCIAAALDEALPGGDYEFALDRMVKDCPAEAIRVGDLPWTEIDFPEDVAKAQALLARMA